MAMQVKGQFTDEKAKPTYPPILSIVGIDKSGKRIQPFSEMLEESCRKGKPMPEVLPAMSSQVVYNTVPEEFSVTKPPFKESAYKLKENTNKVYPWLTYPQPSNDESFVESSPQKVTTTPTKRRKSLIKYSPEDERFLQNRNLHLKSWLEMATPVPNNLISPIDSKSAVIRSRFNSWKSRGKPKTSERKPIVKMEETIPDWYKVKASNPSAYPDVEGWEGWARPPTIAKLLHKEYKNGFSLSKAIEQKYKKSLKQVNATDDKLDISAYEVQDIEVWREEKLLLSLKPTLNCKEKHYKEYESSDTDYIKYDNWMLNNAFHNQPDLSNGYRKATSARYLDCTHYISDDIWDACWDKFYAHEAKKQFDFWDKWHKATQILDKKRYDKWLMQRSKLNPHVDYLPGKLRVEVDGKLLFLGVRNEFEYDLIQQVVPVPPSSRFLKSDTKTRLSIDKDSGKWILETIPNNSDTSASALWNRYSRYVRDFEAGKISKSGLYRVGQFIYDEVCDEWLLKQLPAVAFGNGDEDESSFLNEIKDRITTQELVDKLLETKFSKKPNWSETEVFKATKDPESVTPPDNHSSIVESFVMKSSEAKFKRLTSGILVPEHTDTEGHFVLSETDESIWKMVSVKN